MNPFEMDVHLRHVREQQERSAQQAQRLAEARAALRGRHPGVRPLRAPIPFAPAPALAASSPAEALSTRPARSDPSGHHPTPLKETQAWE